MQRDWRLSKAGIPCLLGVEAWEVHILVPTLINLEHYLRGMGHVIGFKQFRDPNDFSLIVYALQILTNFCARRARVIFRDWVWLVEARHVIARIAGNSMG